MSIKTSGTMLEMGSSPGMKEMKELREMEEIGNYQFLHNPVDCQCKRVEDCQFSVNCKAQSVQIWDLKLLKVSMA